MSWKDTGFGISVARGTSFWTIKAMEESLENCHRLFGKKIPVYDMMYMINVLTYGQLQRYYKEKI
jgi:hypothetical protein